MDRLPLYERLRSVLRDRIERGELRPGDTFPSESELITEHALSRITVRRAIAELQREGLVTTRQGAGTFVADASRANAQCLLSFTSDVLRRGHSPGAELIAFDTARGPADRARLLGLPADARLVHIKRVRTVDDEPVYLSDACIPAYVLPDIAPDDLARSGLEQSLYRLIERHHPVPLEDGEEVATAVIADEEVERSSSCPRTARSSARHVSCGTDAGSPIIYEEATWGVPRRSAVVWRRSVAAPAGNGN